MKKFNKKALNVLATTALVASIATPVFANSTNLVKSVPSVDDEYESADVAGKQLTDLIIKTDDTTIGTGERFRLVLPAGVKWVKDAYTTGHAVGTAVYEDGDANFYAEVTSASDQTLEFVTKGTGNLGTDQLSIPMFVEVDGAEGEIKVQLESIDGTLTSGSYTIANVSSGKTNTVVEKVETISDQDKVGTIRIDETAIGALYNDGAAQKITLKLPSGFEWKTAPKVQFAGGFASLTDKKVGKTKAGVATVSGSEVQLDTTNAVVDERTLEFYVQFPTKAATRGTIYLKDAVVSVDGEPSYGDVKVSISGDKVTSQELLLAEYSDYTVKVTADEDAKEIVSGRLKDTDDLKLAKLKLKEGIAGSLLPNRKTKFEFPAGVKVVDVEVKKSTGAVSTLTTDLKADIDGTSNEVEVVINDTASTSTKIDVELVFYVSVKADFTGDITAKVSGRSTAAGEAVLGKAVAPVTATAEAKDVKVGIKGQAIGDFVIAESAKEALIKDGELKLVLSEGEWNAKPTVEVVEGDLELDLDNLSKSGDTVTVPVKHESSKPSKIKVSNAKIDLNRAVPEGEVKVDVKGSALVENHKDQKGFNGKKDLVEGTAGATDTIDAGEFDKSTVVSVKVAEVVTPAPGEVAATAQFVIDSTSYTVNGVEKTVDVAPFIDGGRTYLPVRFVADALGVSESNIIWDANTKTVTLIKGDRVAQLAIGSKTLKVNGASITMDAAAQVKDGRTVLPIRYVAQALGANVQWDEATRTVTITNK